MPWALIRNHAGRVVLMAVTGAMLLLAVAGHAWASNWQDQSTVAYSVTAGHWTQPDSEESEASNVELSDPEPTNQAEHSDRSATGITYSGSSVFVVPIEDVITETIGGPTQQTITSSPSVMLYTGDSAQGATCAGGEGTTACGGEAEPEPEVVEELAITTIEEPAPTPTPTPRVPQTPRLAGGGGR